MGGVKAKLTASLAAAWEAEMRSVMTLEKLAERAPEVKVRSRLSALAAGCQAHASRLLARLAAVGGGPLPVPPEDVALADSFTEALRAEAVRTRDSADRYAAMANLARRAMDPSAAWVCELNRAEELDRSFELAEMAQRFGANEFLAPPA